MGRGNRWTKKQERTLFHGIGVHGIAWFRARIGKATDLPNAPQRSRQAIYRKVLKEYGPGGLTRGAYTLNRLVGYTGYTKLHLRRAQSALGQKWKRLGPKGAYLITEDQVEEILEWLQHDYWCVKHRLYHCLWCQTMQRPPLGRGLCQRCYYRYRRRCVREDLPITACGQLELLQKSEYLEYENRTAYARFFEMSKARLIKGLAIDEEFFDWMVMLRP